MTESRFAASLRQIARGFLNLEKDRRSGGSEARCFCDRRGTDRDDGGNPKKDRRQRGPIPLVHDPEGPEPSGHLGGRPFEDRAIHRAEIDR